jgi:DNA-binding CsgD family transcriptional regulator
MRTEQNPVSQNQAQIPSLSPRERRVIELMCEGLQPAQIARRLGISVKTVSTYRDRLRRKLPVKNSTQIGIWAERNGWTKSVILGGVSR